jgi:hypothetical protein
MSLTTYAELQTAISNWLHRADMAANTADLITLAEDRINLEVRAREMETALSVSIVGGVATVPTDFTALRYAYIDGSPVQTLAVKSVDWMLNAFPLRSASGKPRYIAVDGSNFIFGPFADSGYSVVGTYYKRFSALSTGVNALYTRVPSLYLFCALAEANAFIQKDPRIALWEAKYIQIRDRINGVKDEGAYSGGGLAMTVDFATG